MMRLSHTLWGLTALILVGCESGAIDINDDTDTDTDEETLEDGAISVTPGTMDLGLVFVGQTASDVIEVSNIGKRRSEVSLSILGDALGEYTLSPFTSAPESGDTAEHTVTFSPTEWGNKSISILVADAISEGQVEVVVTAESQIDADGDGFGSLETGGDDCDDTLATTYPGAEDAWYDGVDSDCEGNDDFDQDGDGFQSAEYGGDDCDDLEPATNPGAEDTWYDGIDSNCDGANDYDQDGDGVASAEYGGSDCDDLNAEIYPGAEDAWYDGIDSDCEGNDDFDQDGDGFASSEYGGEDCDDTNVDINPGMTEIWYDGIDSDCDGANDFDQDGDGLEVDDDCDDTDATILGPVPETLDGTDEDCDGLIDDVDLADVVDGSLYGPTAGINIGGRGKFMVGGDIDGDSVADLIAFSVGTYTSGSTNYGRAWVVSGSDLTSANGDIGDYDLASIAATSYYYRFGNISGPMKDMDGDGTDDFFANIYYWPSGSYYHRGYGMFFSGVDVSGSLDTGDANASFTNNSGDGSWVSDTGDFNGDGDMDVMLGSPRDDTGSGGGYKSNCGSLALFLGDSTFSGSYDLGDADDITYGDSGNDYMGYKLHMTDINGDGYEDILVGAPYNDDNTSNGGVVYGLMGSASPSWTGNDIQNDADFAIYGDSANLNLGEDEIPMLGDNDGDGRKDLVLASERNGSAWLFFQIGTFSGDYDTSDADHDFSGPAGDYASAVLSHADLDGDGDDEIVFGGDSSDTAGSNRGAVYRYDYSTSWPTTTIGTTNATATIWGDANEDYLGTGLSGGYDLDGDGKDDLLIGAVGADGGASDGGGLFFVSGW